MHHGLAPTTHARARLHCLSRDPGRGHRPGRIIVNIRCNPVVATSLVVAAITVLACGCAAPAPAKSKPPIAPGAGASGAVALNRNTDPCAMRLHEASGALLLYYATHHDLPKTLADLEKSPGGQDLGDLTCPVSHKPYLYSPAGVPAPDASARLVLYDPEPSHAGMRWAVAILPPTADGPLIAKVIAVPESHFVRLPRTATGP